LHGVTPETTTNFSDLPEDLRQCAYNQGEPVTNDLSFGTQVTLVMCRSFLNNSDVRGKDCTLQVKFFCLRTLASSEIYRGISFL
jgi:membrane protein involved in colicin uptake